jgi:hypothetical protein
MSAVSADDKWDLVFFTVKTDFTRESLVVVRMPGKKCVRVDSDSIANLIDFAEHLGAGTVVPTTAATLFVWAVSKRGMMRSQKHSAFILFGFDSLQLGLHKFQLVIGHCAPLSGLAGYHSGILE